MKSRGQLLASSAASSDAASQLDERRQLRRGDGPLLDPVDEADSRPSLLLVSEGGSREHPWPADPNGLKATAGGGLPLASADTYQRTVGFRSEGRRGEASDRRS
jgi:hypothetical protein